MAYDKVVDSTVLDNGLKSIADAIREKAGMEDNFAFPEGFAEAIAGIEVGGDYRLEITEFIPAETITAAVGGVFLFETSITKALFIGAFRVTGDDKYNSDSVPPVSKEFLAYIGCDTDMSINKGASGGFVTVMYNTANSFYTERKATNEGGYCSTGGKYSTLFIKDGGVYMGSEKYAAVFTAGAKFRFFIYGE